MVSEIENTLELDRKKLNAMKMKIIQKERLNVKTKQYNKGKMVEEIRKIITDELKKNI